MDLKKSAFLHRKCEKRDTSACKKSAGVSVLKKGNVSVYKKSAEHVHKVGVHEKSAAGIHKNPIGSVHEKSDECVHEKSTAGVHKKYAGMDAPALKRYARTFALLFCTVFLACALLSCAGKGERLLFERSFYGLVFYRGKDAGAAADTASFLRIRGGAGYIEKAGDYRVFACVYFDRADAVRVAERIRSYGTECSVEQIYCPAVFRGGFSEADARYILSACELFGVAFEALENAYSMAEAGAEVLAIRAEISALRERVKEQKEGIFSETGGKIAVRAVISGFFETVQAGSERLSGCGEREEFSVCAKYELLALTFAFRDFCENLAAMG